MCSQTIIQQLQQATSGTQATILSLQQSLQIGERRIQQRSSILASESVSFLQHLSELTSLELSILVEVGLESMLPAAGCRSSFWPTLSTGSPCWGRLCGRPLGS